MFFSLLTAIISVNALSIAKTYALKSSTLHIKSVSTPGDLMVIMAKSNVSYKYLNFEKFGNFSCGLIPKLQGRNLQSRLLINGTGDFHFPYFGLYTIAVVNCDPFSEFPIITNVEFNIQNPIKNYSIIILIEFIALFIARYSYNPKDKDEQNNLLDTIKKKLAFLIMVDMIWILSISFMLYVSEEDIKKYINYHRYIRLILFIEACMYIGSGVPSISDYSDIFRYFGIIFAVIMSMFAKNKSAMLLSTIVFLGLLVAYQYSVYLRTSISLRTSKKTLDPDSLKSLKNIDFFSKSIDITKKYMKKGIYSSFIVVILETFFALTGSDAMCFLSVVARVIFYCSVLSSLSKREGMLTIVLVNNRPELTLM